MSKAKLILDGNEFELSAMDIPTNMFTVMFARGRLPGWIAHWKEMREDPRSRINRPRQIYVGEKKRPWVPIDQRSDAASES